MSAVTEVVAEYAAANAHLADPGKAWGRCVTESFALGWNLRNTPGAAPRLIRTTGQNYPGREHWALITDWDEDADPSGFTVVDLTARQFDRTAEFPWVGTLIDWYDVVCDWHNDHIDVEVHPLAYGTTAAEWTDHYARDDHEPGEPMRDGLSAAVDTADMDEEIHA